MPLVPGDRLGPYEILAPLGAGGMGEVYRARDSRLNRDVAIKISKDQFTERFEREARAVAALNHPNICHLYDIGPNYLVMEFVEGDSPKGPMPLEEALRIARQIAEALDAAHEKNIVHRDLKPANIKITPAGVVKVLDFGLAKITPADGGGPVSENSPTLSMAATQAGVILGTAAYMAPEQAKGKPADKRADIWAFGVVLYEMLAGERLFKGDDISEILAGVIKEKPDFADVPIEVRRLLKKCLEKDPAKRLRDIGDVWELLEEGGTAVPPQGPALPHKGATSNLPWVAAGVCLLAAVGLGYLAFRPVEPPRNLKLSLLLPEGTAFLPTYSLPAVSPDGRRLAVPITVNGKTELWVRELDSLSARPLTGTEGAELPFWSPDSRWIGFFTGGKLKKIDVTGGPATTMCDASGSPRGGTWNRNDVIIFAPANTSGLSQCPAAGGTATAVTKPDAAVGFSHRYPWFLPDGRHFLYTAVTADPEKRAIYVADLDAKDEAKACVRILAADSNAVYSPPGYLLFVRERTLMAQPFDAGKLQLTGGAVPVAEDVDYLANNNQGRFAVSQGGVLAYTSGAGGGGQQQLTWFDRSGKPAGTLGKPGDLQWPAISWDGKSVAVDRRDPQTGSADIWLYDLTHGNESRFTFGPQNNTWPVWSGDGSHIAFVANRGGKSEIYQRATSGTAQDELVSKADGNIRADDWSRDGRYILESRAVTPKTQGGFWVLPLFDKKEAVPYLVSEFQQGYAKLSPDGRWLAYQSQESKRAEIYVQTFPMKGGKWQVSINGGTHTVWSRDGKELYFIGADQKMMAVPIKAGATFEWGAPTALFDVRMLPDRRFDVSKDGRFLIPTSSEQAGSVPITVVNNWQAGLKK